MAARKQSLLTAFLDWIVLGPELRARAPQAPTRQPRLREGRSDSNLFALLCRLTC